MTGRFGGITSDLEAGYRAALGTLNKTITDGRHYLIRIRAALESDEAALLADPKHRITVHIVLADYQQAKVGEVTVLPNLENHPEYRSYSALHAGDDGDVPCLLAALDGAYLESLGWIAPNGREAYQVISTERFNELRENPKS